MSNNHVMRRATELPQNISSVTREHREVETLEVSRVVGGDVMPEDLGFAVGSCCCNCNCTCNCSGD